SRGEPWWGGPDGDGPVCPDRCRPGHRRRPPPGRLSAMADAVELELAGRTVRITHPDKVFFPRLGATKLDLVRYYEAVAEPLLAALGGRPVLLERYPDGAGGKSFFQKRVPASAPSWLRTVEVATPNGTTSDALVL